MAKWRLRAYENKYIHVILVNKHINNSAGEDSGAKPKDYKLPPPPKDVGAAIDKLEHQEKALEEKLKTLTPKKNACRSKEGRLSEAAEYTTCHYYHVHVHRRRSIRHKSSSTGVLIKINPP